MGAPGVGYGYHEPDARDPNYDEVAQGDTVCATVVPELEEDELEQNVQPMVLEYCEHGDSGEVVELLRGLNLGGRRHAVPELAVEGRASHRELLSELVGRVLSPEDVAWAFDEMLRDPPDLILDTPEAPQGFQRVYAALNDLSLDAPLAHARLEQLLELCCQRGVVTRTLRDACNARARKRFVSEGDGGRVQQ